jgi:serine/threonine protein phosphatase PrpC
VVQILAGVDATAFSSRRSPRPLVAGTAIMGSRSEQQDRYRFNWMEEDQAWLLVLADGMGGHEGGAVASKIVVDAFTAAFYSRRKQQIGLQECLEASLNAANLLLADAQRDNIQLSGMGTTLVAAHLSEAGLIWISVGDSPLWLLRGGQMLRLNDDHSLRGIAGASSKSANMLQSALTGQPIPLIDTQFEPVLLQSKDMLILSSDGLLSLPEKTIAKVAAKHFPSSQAIADALVGAITKKGRNNQDNCTVVVATQPQSGLALPGAALLWRRASPQTVLVVVGLLIVVGVLAAAFYLLADREN